MKYVSGFLLTSEASDGCLLITHTDKKTLKKYLTMLMKNENMLTLFTLLVRLSSTTIGIIFPVACHKAHCMREFLDFDS